MSRKENTRYSLVGSLLLSFAILSTATFNITAILDEFPDFTILNELLTETKVADEINARRSLTLLAPSNDAMTAFRTTNPGIKGEKVADLLRYHVLLRYLTILDLQSLPTDNHTTVSTLLRDTGRENGEDGKVNIYSTRTKILVGHSRPDNYPNSTVVNTAYQEEDEISVIMIDRTLEPAGFEPASVTGANITGVLEDLGGYTTFVRLLKQTGVDEVFESRQAGAGVAIFVPTDAAFAALPSEWIEGFELEQQRLLLQYHALTKYRALGALWQYTDKLVETVSSTIVGPDSYNLLITADTGVVTIFCSTPNRPNATLVSTLYDANPVIIYSIDSVLLPEELFGDVQALPIIPLSPALAPASEPTPAPPPVVDSKKKAKPALAPVAPPATSAGASVTVRSGHLLLVCAILLWSAGYR